MPGEVRTETSDRQRQEGGERGEERDKDKKESDYIRKKAKWKAIKRWGERVTAER